MQKSKTSEITKYYYASNLSLRKGDLVNIELYSIYSNTSSRLVLNAIVLSYDKNIVSLYVPEDNSIKAIKAYDHPGGKQYRYFLINRSKNE